MMEATLINHVYSRTCATNPCGIPLVCKKCSRHQDHKDEANKIPYPQELTFSEQRQRYHNKLYSHYMWLTLAEGRVWRRQGFILPACVFLWVRTIRYIFKGDEFWRMSRILWRQEGQCRKGSQTENNISFNVESWNCKVCWRKVSIGSPWICYQGTGDETK